MASFNLTKKRLFIILGIIIALVALPLILYQAKQQQQLDQEANVSKNRECGDLLQVTVTDSTNSSDATCKNISPGQSQSFTTYTTNFAIRSLDGKEHKINYNADSNFCTRGFSGDPFCSDNPELLKGENDVIVPPEGKTLSFSRSSPTGVACGSYQIDLEINVIDGMNVNNSDATCKWSQEPGQANLAGWGACETGIDECTAAVPPTATPTSPAPPPAMAGPTSAPTATPTVCPYTCASSINQLPDNGSGYLNLTIYGTEEEQAYTCPPSGGLPQYCYRKDLASAPPPPQQAVAPTSTPTPTPIPPTNTPTPSPTPTSTPSPTPTRTPTPTPPPVIVPTSTPTPVIIAQVVQVVAPTSTPFPTPTIAPPVIIYVTPTPYPTLPPTGPANVTSMGAVGIIFTIIGAFIFFLL